LKRKGEQYNAEVVEREFRQLLGPEVEGDDYDDQEGTQWDDQGPDDDEDEDEYIEDDEEIED
jgi:hypothetical protein